MVWAYWSMTEATGDSQSSKWFIEPLRLRTSLGCEFADVFCS